MRTETEISKLCLDLRDAFSRTSVTFGELAKTLVHGDQAVHLVGIFAGDAAFDASEKMMINRAGSAVVPHPCIIGVFTQTNCASLGEIGA